MKNNAICERKIEYTIITIRVCFSLEGKKNPCAESRNLWYGNVLCPRKVHWCIDCKLSWLRQVVHFVSVLPSKVRKNTEKAEMSQKRSAQQEHGKDGKHKS